MASLDLGIPQLLTPIDSLKIPFWMHYILCFPFPPDSSPGDIFNIHSNLTQSLEKTVSLIPILKLSFTPVPLSPGTQRGRHQLSTPSYNISEIFNYKDLPKSDYDYASMTATGFSPAQFKYNDFVLPDFQRLGSPTPGPAPVMRVQMTVMNGGFMLYLCVHHYVMDGNATMTILRVWSECYRTGSADVSQVVLDRSGRLMDGRGPGRLEDHPAYFNQEYDKWTTPPNEEAFKSGSKEDQEAVSIILRFSAKSLRTLKEHSNGWAQKLDVDRLTTNDLLTALLWTTMVASRHPEGTSRAPGISKCFIAVNGRQRLNPPLSKEYMGNFLGDVPATAEYYELWEAQYPGSSPIKHFMTTAARISKGINTIGDDQLMDFIAMIRNQEDVAKLNIKVNLDEDIWVLSWADWDVYGFDWGDLGFCDSFRTVGMTVGGLANILPRGKTVEGHGRWDGVVEAMITLKKGEMEMLKRMELIKRFATYFDT